MPNRADDFPAHMSRAEAAAFLGVSLNTVRRLLQERTLPYHRVRNRVLLARADLDHFLHAQRVPSRTEGPPHVATDLPAGAR